ncbi:MAG: type II secretion system major pseudopilin GspG [Phycisphaerae bacterium]|nr:type II secretion system major pseudopilin GspG [Phycisphaerae bacterium]
MPKTQRRRLAPAFTLLEVMIVIVIILAIMGFVAVNVMGSRDTATKRLAEIQLKTIKQAMEQFNLDFNRYPTDEEGIKILWDKAGLDAETDAKAWRAYMAEPVPKDNWGSEWYYRQQGEKCPAGKFDLMSNGPDKQFGTEDDINAWRYTGEGEGDMGGSGSSSGSSGTTSGTGGGNP